MKHTTTSNIADFLNARAATAKQGSNVAVADLSSLFLGMPSTQLNAQTAQSSAQLLPSTQYLSLEDVSSLTGIKKRTLQDHCKKGKYQTTTETARGGTRYLIALSSLPADAQARHFAQTQRETKQAKRLVPIASLAEAQDKRLAREREIVAQALSTPPESMRLTEYREWVAECHGIDAGTLYRWIKKHTAPREAVVEREGYKIDFSEFRKFSPVALDWAVGRRMSFPMEAIDNTFAELTKEATKRGWSLGSKKRFYAAMQRIPEALKIAATEGRRGLDNKIAPVVLRDLSQYAPLELVCGDQMISDYYCYNQYGEVITPEFYAWIDMGTSMVVGLAMTTGRYNKYLIGESLKQVCRHGIIKEVYTDNGKPELSKHLTAILAQLEGCTFTDYQDGIDKRTVKHKLARPRNSKAKPIESYFGHIQKRLLSLTGGRGYKKYEHGDNDLLRQDLLKEAIKNGELYSLEELSRLVLEAVSWWNSHFNKSRKLVAEEAFFAGLEERPRPQISDAALDYIFLPAKRCTVRNSCVTIVVEGESCRFMSEKLALYQGKKIEVRWNPTDLDQVYLLDNNELIDIAVYKGKINPKDGEDLRQAMTDKNNVIRAWEQLRKGYMSVYTGKVRKAAKVEKITAAIGKATKSKAAISLTDEERDALLDQKLGIA